MKRRRFLSAVAAAPAAPALLRPLAAQQPAAAAGATPQLLPAAGTGRGGRGGGPVPHIPLVEVDEAAATLPHYFSAPRFSALRKLAALLEPPLKGNIGALDCDAVEFLDFLLSVSPADQQQLYGNGLDALNSMAKKQFGKLFAELDKNQADAVLKPLVVPVAWVYDPPKDPVKHFIFQARQDIRTATRNSLEAARAQANSGRRGTGGAGLYWKPIDPV